MKEPNTNSPSFGIRQPASGGNLGASSNSSGQPVLGLATKRKKLTEEYEDGRVLNLRLLKKVLALPKEKPPKVKVKRGRKKVLTSQASGSGSDVAGPLRYLVSQPVIKEALEISSPDRENILAVLEEIEQVNKYLKTYGLAETEIDQAIRQAEEELSDDLTQEILRDITEGAIEVEMAAESMEAVVEQAAEEGSLESIILLESSQEVYEEQQKYLAQQQARESLIQAAVLAVAEARAPVKQWSLRDFIKQFKRPRPELKKGAVSFAGLGLLILLVIFGMSLAGKGLLAKGNILGSALQAYQAMLAAKDSAARLDFSSAGVNFETAYQNFWQADQELGKMGRTLIAVLEKLPGGSAVKSGAALVEVGENLARAGQSFSKMANLFLVQNLGSYFSGSGESLTQKIGQAQDDMQTAQAAISLASAKLAEVNEADLPSDMAPAITSLKEKMPFVSEALSQLNRWSNVFLEFLGHQKAKKYLLVFQNNSEARPTGGFIGTYGVLDLNEGRITNLQVDGIFNLDGQLYEKIVPPRPIQKISTAWSTHDANWFADFPSSAKKIMSFYEKAGGSTADGVISLTPTIIERLLSMTGPIEMPAYNATLTAANFMDLTQYKVEVDYDKQLNQPKKILADFVPLFLERLWQIWPQRYQEILPVITDALKEKHVLFYFSDAALEKVFVEQGWGGEILSTDKDYLAVINTNVNGFKTDRVIEQKIYHQSQVQVDGSVVDTVKIIRRHNGGQSQYDWYNKVNADYLRVYVPRGSKLLAAQGQTLEGYVAPIDYQAQGFKNDADVLTQEQGTIIDQKSGTQIFEESGKSVFGNWVYVSPGEAVELTYQYQLPFRLDLSADNFSWSMLAQKQSGSLGSQFESILQLPQEFKIDWQYPANLEVAGQQIKFSGDLKTDEFYGLVIGR